MNDNIILPATLESRTSKEGNPYICISVKITDTYEKVVFLDRSEIELIKMVYSKEKASNRINLNKASTENN